MAKPTVRRQRNCSSCGKPLGSTYGKCHDCGGESVRGSLQADGRGWKLYLGVSGDQIDAAEEEYGTDLPLDN